jgi:NAD(P)-dependent dehydrogenase (short-subunit alcohol dehydrogenase family)
MTKTIVITGSSTGIGRAAALLFSSRGWNVAATMRSPEQEKELQKAERCSVYKLDVTDESSVLSARDAIIGDLGHVDVVVNNAGYALMGAFEAISEKQIRRQFDTNLFGLMAVTRAFLPLFRSQRAGMFINVSSIGGLTTTPLASLYHATKWAVEGFSEALVYELNPLGIQVKLVEPGRTMTDFATRSQERVINEELADYKETISRIQAKLANAWDPSLLSPASAVADVIYQAATDGSSRIRYIAGSDASERYEHRRLHGDQESVERMRRQFLSE